VVAAFVCSLMCFVFFQCFVFKIDQDFTMLFGEEVSGKFLAKWPTFFKPRVIADCKNLPRSAHVDELLFSAQQESDDGGKCKIETVDFTCQ